MSRPARQALPTSNRERLKQDFTRAAPLRELYPQLAEVRVELEFRDGDSPSHTPQSYSYFPAARGFFRYACPCHGCSGEFDLSTHVAGLAGGVGKSQRTSNVVIPCMGQRVVEFKVHEACPIRALVRISAILHVP